MFTADSDIMSETEIITLICIRENFRPAPTDSVRWLAPNADFYRVQQAMRSNGLEPPAFEAWLDWHRQGYRFCAKTPQGIIVAQAAVLMATLPAHVNFLEAIVLPVGQLYVGRG